VVLPTPPLLLAMQIAVMRASFGLLNCVSQRMNAGRDAGR
jgi:hypothetical protein